MPKPAESREAQESQVLTPHGIFGKLPSLFLLISGVTEMPPRDAEPHIQGCQTGQSVGDVGPAAQRCR